MKEKKDLHYLRKLNHAIPGLIVFLLLIFNIVNADFLGKLILSAYLIISFLEIFRLTHEPFNQFFCSNLKFLLRNNEKEKPTTTTFYLLSLSISILFFPIEIFYIALLTLSFGDPLASIIGLKNKDNKNNIIFKNNKSLYGSLTLAITGFLFSLIFLTTFGYNFQSVFNFAIIYAINLFLMEIFVEHLDDNLYIPLLVIPSYLLILI